LFAAELNPTAGNDNEANNLDVVHDDGGELRGDLGGDQFSAPPARGTKHSVLSKIYYISGLLFFTRPFDQTSLIRGIII